MFIHKYLCSCLYLFHMSPDDSPRCSETSCRTSKWCITNVKIYFKSNYLVYKVSVLNNNFHFHTLPDILRLQGNKCKGLAWRINQLRDLISWGRKMLYVLRSKTLGQCCRWSHWGSQSVAPLIGSGSRVGTGLDILLM